jgi:PERQ amino acid-rich with GYF domain-containing protein
MSELYLADKCTVNSIASTLMNMPLEPQIITEIIYSSSTTMDARHFSEEFIRRKKLADKGIVEKASTTSTTGASSADLTSGKNVSGAAGKDTGGWSEVAKKSSGSGSAGASGRGDDIPGASVKVVQGKRKGRK